MNVTGTVEIKDDRVHSRTVRGNKGNWEARHQEGMVQIGPETRVVRLSLSADQAPYATGKYSINTPLSVNQYGDLQVPRYLALSPAK